MSPGTQASEQKGGWALVSYVKVGPEDELALVGQVIKMPVGMGSSCRFDRNRARSGSIRHLSVSATLTKSSSTHPLPRLSPKTYLPPELPFVCTTPYPTHLMAGTKESKNRSHSREEDEVRTPIQPPAIPDRFVLLKRRFAIQSHLDSDEDQSTNMSKPGRKKNPKCGQYSCFRRFRTLNRPHRHRAYVVALSRDHLVARKLPDVIRTA